MASPKLSNNQWLILGAVAGVTFFVIKKGGIAGALSALTSGAVSTGADIAGGIGSGVVLGIGDVLGVERTELQKCKACIAKGDNMGASKYCSAGVFARWQYLSTLKRLTGKTFTMADIFN